MQRLARHSTVELTLGRYTHANIFDLTAAVKNLPKLTTSGAPIPEVATLQATGTTGAVTRMDQNSMSGSCTEHALEMAAGLAAGPIDTGCNPLTTADVTGVESEVLLNCHNPQQLLGVEIVQEALISGGRGIRTPAALAGRPVFKTDCRLTQPVYRAMVFATIAKRLGRKLGRSRVPRWHLSTLIYSE